MKSKELLQICLITILIALTNFALFYFFLGPNPKLTLPGWDTTILEKGNIIKIIITATCANTLAAIFLYKILVKKF